MLPKQQVAVGAVSSEMRSDVLVALISVGLGLIFSSHEVLNFPARSSCFPTGRKGRN
jgi:hypothetical protein